MRVISRKMIRLYWERRPEAEQELKAWFAEAMAATWRNPSELKAKYGNASILQNGRVVFNICGNKQRLIVWIHYRFQIVYIRFIGTHQEYDKINAQEI